MFSGRADAKAEGKVNFSGSSFEARKERFSTVVVSDKIWYVKKIETLRAVADVRHTGNVRQNTG